MSRDCRQDTEDLLSFLLPTGLVSGAATFDGSAASVSAGGSSTLLERLFVGGLEDSPSFFMVVELS